jgi:hypothetical protein
MTDDTDEPTSTRDEYGRWRKGYAPNRKGRPPGSRHRTTLAIEALLEGEAEALTRKVIELAMNGDDLSEIGAQQLAATAAEPPNVI